MSDIRELSNRFYQLKNLFNDLKVYAEQAIEELHIYDNDAAESIKDDLNILIEEAKANKFIE